MIILYSITYILLLTARWSVGCDDDGSTSSSALVGSHVTLKTNAGAADPAAYCAGEPPVFHVHVLLMASLSSETHEFVLTLLAFLSPLVAFRAPTTALCR